MKLYSYSAIVWSYFVIFDAIRVQLHFNDAFQLFKDPSSYQDINVYEAMTEAIGLFNKAKCKMSDIKWPVINHVLLLQDPGHLQLQHHRQVC